MPAIPAPYEPSYDFATDPAPQDKVNAAALQTQLQDISENLSDLIDAVSVPIRAADVELADALVRLRNLHPEVATLLDQAVTGTAASYQFVWKQPVRAASAANLASLSGPQTVDGVACVAGDRVLLKSQTTPAQNGLWVVAAGSWSRAADLPASAASGYGWAVMVLAGGTVNGETAWAVIAGETGQPIVGTDPLLFLQTLISLPNRVDRGGTGASTATGARANLGPWGDALFAPQGAPTQRTLATKAGERLSVRDFGAIGDGAADDTAAIQAAITYAQNAANPNAGYILFPAGTYRISAHIAVNAPTGLIIEGVGGKTTILQHSATASVFVIGDDVAEQRHVLIRDIMLRANAANSSAAILAYLLVRSWFEHVIIEPQEGGTIHFATGIDLRGLDYVSVTNCQVRATAYGIQARSRSNNTYGTALYIDGGTKISEVTAGTGVRVHGGLGGVMFGNCDILACTNGVALENSIGHSNREVFFTDGCTLDTCTNYAVVVNNGCVTHLTFDGTWFGTCGGGIYHDDASSITKISDCHMMNMGAPSGGPGIVLARAGHNVTISGCRFNAAPDPDGGGPGLGGGTAIHALAAGSSFVVEGNVIQSWINGAIFPAGVSQFLIADNIFNLVNPATPGISAGTAPNGREKAIRNNIGFITENSGIVQIASALNATALVPHGLTGTPFMVQVTLGDDNGPATGPIASAFTATNFLISLPGGPSTAANVRVMWRAFLYEGG